MKILLKIILVDPVNSTQDRLKMPNASIEIISVQSKHLLFLSLELHLWHCGLLLQFLLHLYIQDCPIIIRFEAVTH